MTQHNETFLADVGRFMLAGGQTLTAFSPRQLALYTGLQLEELAEKIGSLVPPGDYTSGDGGDFELARLTATLNQVSADFKSGRYDAKLSNLSTEDRKEMLDADFDLAWVSVGSAYSLGAKVKRAWIEGTRSNLAKLQPDGTMAKDVNGKITKPKGWTPPDFLQFIYV